MAVGVDSRVVKYKSGSNSETTPGVATAIVTIDFWQVPGSVPGANSKPTPGVATADFEYVGRRIAPVSLVVNLERFRTWFTSTLGVATVVASDRTTSTRMTQENSLRRSNTRRTAMTSTKTTGVSGLMTSGKLADVGDGSGEGKVMLTSGERTDVTGWLRAVWLWRQDNSRPSQGWVWHGIDDVVWFRWPTWHRKCSQAVALGGVLDNSQETLLG